MTQSAEELTREPLTRERILDAAVAIADEHGLEALSMRKVAAELGFEVMSLYNHVDNKTDMQAGMVDTVAGQIELPVVTGPGDWQAAMRASAASAHEVLLRHRWAGPIWNSHMPGPHRIRLMEAILAGLANGGLPDDIVYLGYHALTTHIVGFTREELDLTVTSDMADQVDDFVAGLGDGFPHLLDHIRAHFDGDRPRVDEFVFTLDMILDGLARAAARSDDRP